MITTDNKIPACEVSSLSSLSGADAKQLVGQIVTRAQASEFGLTLTFASGSMLEISGSSEFTASPKERPMPYASAGHEHGYLLSSAVLERSMSPAAPSVIAANEQHGFLISVVVGAGVYRDLTVASLFRVTGAGDRLSPNARRAEMVEVLLKSPSEDLREMAGIVVAAAKRRRNCTVIVDVSGMGTQFIKLLESMGLERVISSSWGGVPASPEYQSRFFNLKAQCTVHAVEALKDSRVVLAADKDLAEQGAKLAYYFDINGRYRMRSREEMHAIKIPSADTWDTIAMAFLESATYAPAR